MFCDCAQQLFFCTFCSNDELQLLHVSHCFAIAFRNGRFAIVFCGCRRAIVVLQFRVPGFELFLA